MPIPIAGTLTELQTISTLPGSDTLSPATAPPKSQVHPSGRFLYGSNRGHNSLTVFAIDQKTGQLTYVQNEPTQGDTPRGFGIDPSGEYLLAGNQRSDSVVVFRIDQQTGRLTPTGQMLKVALAGVREVHRPVKSQANPVASAFRRKSHRHSFRLKPERHQSLPIGVSLRHG